MAKFSSRRLGVSVVLLIVLGTIAAVWFLSRGSSAPPAVAPSDTDRTNRDGDPAMIAAGDEERIDSAPRVPIVSDVPATAEPLPLAPPTTDRALRIFVVDGERLTPIPGASVELHDEAFHATMTTDDRGACETRVAVNAYHTAVTVEAEGHVHTCLWPRITSELVVELPRAITLTGRLLDSETLAPIPGATIRRTTRSRNQCPHAVDAVADVGGHYELHDVPWQGDQFLLSAPAYPAQVIAVQLGSMESRANADFRLQNGIAIRGRVIDFSDSSPIANAKIRAGDSRWVTGADGGFEGHVLAQAIREMPLSVQAPDRCRLVVDWAKLPDLSESSLLLRLPASPVLEVDVSDADGLPLDDVGLSMESARGRGKGQAPGELAESPLEGVPTAWSFQHEAVTRPVDGTPGRQRVQGLVPWDRRAKLSAHRIGDPRLERWLDPLPGPGEVRHLALSMPDHGKQGLAEVHGEVWWNGRPTPYSSITWSGAGKSGTSRFEQAFALEGLTPGTYDLEVEVFGYSGPKQGHRVSVELHAGEYRYQNFDVRTPLAPIAGRVRFRDGGPAQGATVFARLADRQPMSWSTASNSTRTDEHGEFELAVPDFAVDLEVLASLPGTQAGAVTARPGARDLVLEIDRTGVLYLRAIDATSRALVDSEDLEVHLRGPGERAYMPVRTSERIADAEGWIRVRRPPGTLEIRLTDDAAGFRAALTRVEVLPGEEKRIEVALEPGLAIEFRIEPPPNETWSADRVMLREISGPDALWNSFANSSRWLRFDSTGRARLNCLGPGRYALRAMPVDVKLEPREFELREDTREPIVIRWSR